MKLTVYNGSGRGESGNTARMLDSFLKGFTSVEGNTFEMHILMHTSKMDTFTAAFGEAENVLLAFPMYTDMVPGVVKKFIETLAPYCGRQGNPSMAYMIHCGFPEGIQLRALEAYLEKLSRRLGSRHVGTILKGNSEGVRYTPPEKLPQQLIRFEVLGKAYGQTGELDKDILSTLSQPERLPGWVATIFRLLSFTNFGNSGWNEELKKNGAYLNRFARPDVEDK